MTSDLRQIVEKDFEFVQDIPWFKIFKDPKNEEYWRLSTPDKYQTDFMVRVPKDSNWEEFNSKQLVIELFRQHRGETNNKCIWKDCNESALKGIVYCAFLAYTEMNIKE